MKALPCPAYATPSGGSNMNTNLAISLCSESVPRDHRWSACLLSLSFQYACTRSFSNSLFRIAGLDLLLGDLKAQNCRPHGHIFLIPSHVLYSAPSLWTPSSARLCCCLASSSQNSHKVIYHLLLLKHPGHIWCPCCLAPIDAIWFASIHSVAAIQRPLSCKFQ